ncbi:MAG: hypothetical protein ICV66_01530 [Chitinophagaceae bacterium]|nr:hypothetical protein [Chitinophagaceae bacterium]
MNLEYGHLLREDFADESRVWIYQSNRIFTISEALEIEALLKKFTSEWRSHGAEVNAYGNLFFGQFLILMADESQANVSGCSTDSSVHFVRELEQKFKVDFFNRNNLAFVVQDKIQLIPFSQLQYAFEHKFITPDTLYFNNTIQTKAELENSWIVPVKHSWLIEKLKLETNY